MKKFLKIVLSLVLGMAIGLAIAALLIVLFTDTTFSEFAAKFNNVAISEALLSGFVGLVAAVISFIIIVISHEAGHLLFGILSGYRFVSFRIFNLTLIKKDGRFALKRFSIAGTGGQCLLLPPDRPIEKIPTAWYNFGGVFVNILELIAAFFILQAASNAFIIESLVIFILIDAILILINGIPMKISGAGNDAYNMFALRKNMIAKRGLMDALRINCEAQNGTRLKDMPDSWFLVPDTIDFKNPLEVSIPLSAASRLVDELEFEEALKMFEDIYSYKDSIIPLYRKEIECELVFLFLVCGKTDEAKTLLTPDLKRYIVTYRNVMSSKQRILCAIDLYIDNNREKADEIYRNVLSHKNDYLMQGEVISDIAIMRKILGK